MKKRNIIIITLCLLISIVTCSYGTSVSKYYVNNQNLFAYGMEFKNLSFSGDERDISYNLTTNSTYDRFEVQIDIPRGTSWQEGDVSETYSLVDPVQNSGCYITHNPDYPNRFDVNNTNSYTTFGFRLSCPVVENEPIKIKYIIKDQFSNQLDDETEFTYYSTNGYVELQPYEDYIRDKEKPIIYDDDNHLLKINKNLYNDVYIGREIVTWLNHEGFNGNYINAYISSYNITNKASLNNCTGIPGLSITKNDSKYYIVGYNNLFTSYAKTYYNNDDNDVRKNFFFDYVDNMRDSEINDLFYEYILKYMYDNDDQNEEYLTIVNYIDSNASSGSAIDILSSYYDSSEKKLVISRNDLYYSMVASPTMVIVSDRFTFNYGYASLSTMLNRGIASKIGNFLSENTDIDASTIDEIKTAVKDTSDNNPIKNLFVITEEDDYFYFSNDKIKYCFLSVDSINLLLKFYPTESEYNSFEIYLIETGKSLSMSYSLSTSLSDILNDLSNFTSLYGSRVDIDLGVSDEFSLNTDYYTNIGYVRASNVVEIIDEEEVITGLVVNIILANGSGTYSVLEDSSNSEGDTPNSGEGEQSSGEPTGGEVNEPEGNGEVAACDPEENEDNLNYSNYFENYNNYFEDIKEEERE